MILAAGIAAITTTAQAQKISFAPEIGLNLANIHASYKDSSATVKYDDGIKLGVKVGINANIPIGERLVIQPGLFYSIKGTKREETDAYSSTVNETEKNNITLHYADIAVNVQYMFNDPSEGRFFIGIGPYVGVAFSGKSLMSTTYSGTGAPTNPPDVDTSLKFGNDFPSNHYRRFDIGGQVNVGYLLRSGIFFRAMYQQGLVNQIPQGNQNALVQDFDLKSKNTNITISVGYMLGDHPKSKGPKMKGSEPM